MQRRRLILVAAAILVGISLLVTVTTVLAQSNPSSVTVPYSSRLTDETGQPLDGVYAFKFTLYDAETGGQALWSEAHAAVTVKSGNFSLVLGEVQPIPQDVANRKELWLTVSVRGPQDQDFTLLNPRQRFTAPASPSALTCPHNHFTDYWPGTNSSYGIEIDQAGTGDGIRSYTHATAKNYASFYGFNTGTGTALYGYSSGGNGLYAESGAQDAIDATTSGINKSALYAHTMAAGANGVWATSASGLGVMGSSTTKEGISGQSFGSGRSGVYGVNSITTSVGYGVFGRASYGFGLGADGKDDSYSDGVGDVYLAGARGEILTPGSVMETYSNGYIVFDLDEDNNSANQLELWNGAEALVFKVDEAGNTTATGTKSAEVKTTHYGPRQLYSVESPEVWFEDIGIATLKTGAITIKLEPIFAETVDLKTDYHVYVTPLCDEAVVLFVTAKSAEGFTVKGVTLDNQPSNCAFDYRVIAKRLGYSEVRLAPAETGNSRTQEVP